MDAQEARRLVTTGLGSLSLALLAGLAAAETPPEAGSGSPRLADGLLDVTQPPYSADATGSRDATSALQRGVDDARDRGLVCFLPEGTYQISDTISCEQQVRRLDRPRNADGTTQHYWDQPHRIVLFGSGKGKRPVIKLSKEAKGFDDPANPKFAIWIWAQTRNDAPGKDEPEWGKEQPNITFGHVFKGIDIDIRGHAGAIGLRFSGSQGSSLLDCSVQAEGAFAGFSDCPGQGGGTYHCETIGGQYGITLDAGSRFPLLVGCRFSGQTVACVGYHSEIQVPSLLVGCHLEPASGMAVDFTRHTRYAGINLVDCRIDVRPGGFVAGTRKPENIHLESAWVRGAAAVFRGDRALPAAEGWTRIDHYSSSTPGGVHLVNGSVSPQTLFRGQPVPEPPAFETLQAKHYRGVPCVDEPGVVNLRDFGARGDGQTDDTQALTRAIAAADKVFLPKGEFRLTGTLRLRPNTHLFGLTRTYTTLGSGGRDSRGRADPGDPFTLVTVDDPDAAPGLSHLGVRGNIQWQSGKGTSMLAGGFPGSVTGCGGGRFYGVMNMGRQWVVQDLVHPVSLYALNVERVTTNPQSILHNCKHLRIYYFKVEAGTLGRGGDGNTPCAITDSTDIRIYCMYGNVRNLGPRPMLDIANSEGIGVSQLKAFRPGEFPHLRETFRGETHAVPSSTTCALFLRDGGGGGRDAPTP